MFGETGGGEVWETEVGRQRWKDCRGRNRGEWKGIVGGGWGGGGGGGGGAAILRANTGNCDGRLRGEKSGEARDGGGGGG